MRVSLPITIWWRPDRRINKCAAARPSCIAISLVIGSRLATPLTPSVPNNLRMLCFHGYGLLAANRCCHLHHILHSLHVVHAKDPCPTIHCHRHRSGRGPLTFLNRTIHELPKERLLRYTNQQGAFKLLERAQLG